MLISRRAGFGVYCTGRFDVLTGSFGVRPKSLTNAPAAPSSRFSRSGVIGGAIDLLCSPQALERHVEWRVAGDDGGSAFLARCKQSFDGIESVESLPGYQQGHRTAASTQCFERHA